MRITQQQLISEIIAEDDRTTAVFQTFGIDCFNQGHRSVQEVCENRNIEFAILAEDLCEVLLHNSLPAAPIPPKQPVNAEDMFGAMLSEENQCILSLNKNIRTGISRGIALERIQAYTLWFYRNRLRFRFEAGKVFFRMVPGNEHELVKKILTVQRRLGRLVEQETGLEKSLGMLEEELERYVRLGKKLLHDGFHRSATPEQWELITAVRSQVPDSGEWEDEFWK